MEPGTLWLLFAAGIGLLVGFAKTGLPGTGMLVVTLMASLFDAKESVGALLPLLITGDLFALAYYRRHAQWKLLIGLLPFVVVGMVPAALLLSVVDGAGLGRGLGCLVLALLALEVFRNHFGWEHVPKRWWFAAVMGFLAGFATTVGNVAGPIMSLYLISKGLGKHAFMGTGAWYYFIVNTTKMPVFFGLGMINASTLRFDLMAVPFIVIGALIGARVLPKIPQRVFNSLVLILAAAAAVRLVIG